MKYKSYFTFTRAEKTGIIVLLFIILITGLVNLLMVYIVKEEPVDFSEWEIQVEKFDSSELDSNKVPVLLRCKRFDPNSVTEETLLTMGLPEYVARNWVKYIDSGGKFRERSDIKKVYGLSEEHYEQLKEYVVIPRIERGDTPESVVPLKEHIEDAVAATDDSFRSAETKKERSPLPVYISIDLNSADTTQLEVLPGIGPVLSKRIVKYRDLLGGYCNIEQLKEVYGLKDEFYERAAPHLVVDSSKVVKLNVNFATTGELARHPYISIENARKVSSIKSYRGKIKDINEVREVFYKEGELEKLEPYLLFQ